MFAGVTAPVVVCGHTHMQFDRGLDGRRIVNAGSVGMPFGEPGAYWLLLNSRVQWQRTDYDLDAAAARIRRTSYPDAERFASGHVLRPPSEADMLARFG
jgi:diadenosine tetraphosphatase ApaH/serine/threonine PP2A family protein phosphatase